MSQKAQDYIALSIAVLIFVLGFIFLTLNKIGSHNVNAGAAYLCSVSAISLFILFFIDNLKLLRTAAVLIMAFSLFVLLLCSIAKFDAGLMLIGMGNLYFFVFRRIRNTEKEVFGEDDEIEDDDEDDENAYWKVTDGREGEV